MRKTIVGLGEALFDCLPTGRKLGGAPANFAYHASQFGLDGYAVSAVGDDELGQEIKTTFDQVHLKYILPIVAQPTGTVQVTLDAQGVPQYEICLGVAWDNIPLTDEMLALAHRTDAVCFGSLAQRCEKSKNTILAFLDAMPMDAWRVFDINLRQSWYNKEVIEQSLSRCAIFKINDDELNIVAPMLLGTTVGDGEMIARNIDKTRMVCRQLIRQYDLKMLILTCGAVGSYVFTMDDESYIATPQVNVVDTVGAGDSFTAAFVACILLGQSIHEAHRKAVETSAYVCTQPGAMPAMPVS